MICARTGGGDGIIRALSFFATFAGWTPERSRCGDHSTRIRARMGPDRLLQTEYLSR
jgi:hypothetical protein